MENSDFNNFKLNNYELNFLKNLEDLRKDPESFKKKITTLAKTFKGELIEKGNDLLKEIEHLLEYKGENLYLISNKLCKAANEILNKKIHGNNEQLSIIRKYVDQIGKDDFYCLVENDCDDIRTQFIFSRINEGNDEEKVGKLALKNKEISYVGICGNENSRCVVFSKKAEKNAITDYIQYSDLLESYNRFDLDKKGYLNVPQVLSTMKKLNYQVRFPLMYQIMNNYKKEILTFEDFMNSLIDYNEHNEQISCIKTSIKSAFKIEDKSSTKIDLKRINEYFHSLSNKDKETCNIFQKIVDENKDKIDIEIDLIVKYFII